MRARSPGRRLNHIDCWERTWDILGEGRQAPYLRSSACRFQSLRPLSVHFSGSSSSAKNVYFLRLIKADDAVTRRPTGSKHGSKHPTMHCAQHGTDFDV